MKRIVLISIVLTMSTGVATGAEIQSVHVFVALCDNENQGIVPVSKKLGNGENPEENLYWGAMYGVKTFLAKDPKWKIVRTHDRFNEIILERVVFRHQHRRAYMVADAYRGNRIKQAVAGFLKAAAGKNADTVKAGGTEVAIHGGADLLVYVGHNGLMDFNISEHSPPNENAGKNVIVLACKSKSYFLTRLSRWGCRSVLLTNGFMAPEAYTLLAAVEGWLIGESASRIRSRAAQAYHQYQQCGLKAAWRLFYAE
jgi:hypothetical protein